MTTYYVDPVNGLDTNNGLGPDASAVTNKPWKTINKAIGSSGVASGDFVMLAPGSYRETVTVSGTFTSMVTVTGDPANLSGFKTSGGVLVAPGPVIWTNYTTNDTTAPSANRTLSLAGKSFLSFNKIMMIQGSFQLIGDGTGGSHDISFTDCAFLCRSTATSTSVIGMSVGAGVAPNLTIDRCICLFGPNTFVNIGLVQGASGDFDIGVSIKNSFIMAANIFLMSITGASGGLPGGLIVRNNTFYGNTAVQLSATGFSTTNPAKVYNNILMCGAATALVGGTSGQLLEDYNDIRAATARSNVSTGTHSKSNHELAPLFWFGQERIWGMLPKGFLEPMPNSPHLGFGNDGGQSSYDGLNRPRPAGSASALPAIGYLERGNSWIHQTSIVHGSATDGAQCTGPGYQEFDVEVDAIAQSIAVWMQFDSTYDTTIAKPSLEVLANGECGVSAAASIMSAAANTWQQITLNFTPTAKGIVTIRLRSQDANGGGKSYASDKSGW